MNIFLDIASFTVFIALLVTQAGSTSKTANSCVELELGGGRFEDNVTEVNEEGYVHISFVLTHKCQLSNESVRVKVSTMSKGHLTTFCTIIFQENTCKTTDQSLTCHCINKGLMFTSISKKVSLSDKVVIEWNNNHIRGVKSIFLFINESTTKPNIENIREPYIIAICCSIVVVVVIGAAVIIKIRIYRAQDISSFRLHREIHPYEGTTHAICSCDACASTANQSNTCSLAILHQPRVQPPESNDVYLEPVLTMGKKPENFEHKP